MAKAAVNAKLQAWIDKLEATAEDDGKNYRALCPGHDGHALLFFFDDKRDRVVWTCKAGCDAKDLAPLLRKKGLQLHGDRGQFLYTRADGTKAFEKHKFYDKDGKKVNFYKCFSSQGVPFNHRSVSKKTRNADGTCKICGRPGAPETLLYHLDELQFAEEIWLCEGEKDADAVRERGRVATSTMNGADDWNATYRDQLGSPERLVIWADADIAGYKGAWKRYTSLSEFDIEIRVIRAARGKDAFDHFANGLTLSDVIEISPEELAQLANPGTPTESLGAASDFGYTQSDYADIFVNDYSSRFRYISNEDCWLYYNDGRWREDQYDAAFHFAENVCRAILAETPERLENGKPNSKYTTARERCSSANIAAICRIARTRRPIVTVREKFDINPYLVNFPNGTYDLLRDEFREHDQRDMITKQCIYDFDPDATGPVFDEYFAGVQPDPHWREQIMRMLGYSITGRYGEYIFVHTGSGGNGKSTLLKLVAKALGNYAMSASWKVLSGKSETEHETLIASLEGHRFAIVQMGGRSLSSEQLRTLVAEPDFTARKMHQDERTIEATHTFHVAQNDPPPMRDLDPSTRRRIIVVHWGVTVADPDDTLRDRIGEQEGSYVLSQIVLAWSRFVAREMDRTHTQEYFEKNSVYAWASQRLVADADAVVAVATLRADYEEWCKVRGEKPDNENVFGRVLTGMEYQRGNATVDGKWQRVRIGVRLPTD